ncbi:MAG: hypothetical protein IT428_07000 [Planctomycetaceae bacterium]|nr:hypothetical protein [Planctomycetaceae bacterium]
MDPFPGEHERSLIVKRELHQQFALAERVHHFWRRWLDGRGYDLLWQSRFKPPTLHLTHALNIQMLRLFRSVIEEAYRAEAYSGNILARSMFETTIALVFTLKGTVRIETFPHLDKTTNKQTTSKSGMPKYGARPKPKSTGRTFRLSRLHRANLYLTHNLYVERDLSLHCSGTKGMKRIGARLAAAGDPQQLLEYEKKIGAEWASVLQLAPHTYSGLKLKALVELIDRPAIKWYETLYGIQSGMVHASRAQLNLEPDEEAQSLVPAYVSSVKATSGALMTATAMALRTIQLTSKYIDFGAGTEMIRAGLFRQFHECYPKNQFPLSS